MNSPLKLIYIISQPRSGSTLLQSLISGSPEIASSSEPWLLLPFASILNLELNNSVFNSDLALKAVREFYEKESGGQKFETKITSMLNEFYASYHKTGIRYFLDKTPRYYEILDFIQKNFPDAKIIILKRNPLNVLNSIIDTWGANKLRKLAFYKRDILSAPHLLQDFLDRNQNNSNVYEIHYENLILDPEHQIGQIYKWLEVPFDKKILNYTHNKKYIGQLGDPTGIHTFSSPTQQNKDWQDKLKDPYWKDFFKGYCHYLGKDFLKKYGNYTANAGSPTSDFSNFKFYCDNQMESLKIKKGRSIFRYLSIYLKNKFSKKSFYSEW